ncbi:MAG: lipoate--protein ligase family protein [Nitrospirae bacterium]|nr:lipoate--protein ligase family protein [Nitrospirota bacterium]
MFWRFIDDKARSASLNMALDEAISEAVRKKLSPPTLRLYQWENPSITIGYFQNISDIDLDYCREINYPVVRRCTGGKAILHNFELTYSFSASNGLEPFNRGLVKNYLLVNSALASGLRQVNLPADTAVKKKCRQRDPLCFKTPSFGEITVNGEKIIGSAQKRYSNGFMQQGSIIMDVDTDELRRIVKHHDLVMIKGSEEGVRKAPEEYGLKAGTIKKYAPSVSVDELRTALKKAFEQTFNTTFVSESPTEFEARLAEKLEAEKYSSHEWNFRR